MNSCSSKFLLSCACAAALGALAAGAEPTPAAATPAPKPAETTAAPLAPDNLVALHEALGKQVVIEGTPTKVGESLSKKVRFLDFGPMGKAVSLVVMVGRGEPIPKEVLEGYVGKKVRVTGLVSEYQTHPQVIIEKKSQLEIVP